MKIKTKRKIKAIGAKALEVAKGCFGVGFLLLILVWTYMVNRDLDLYAKHIKSLEDLVLTGIYTAPPYKRGMDVR